MLADAMTDTPAAHHGFEGISDLSDDELLLGTRALVARSNQFLARLLAHLGEVEARGIHRTRACASLYTYCIYELRMSEDAAYRRARAAKFARQFPRLLEAIEAGEIHLTGLLLLGPHLTQNNHVEVLARAKYRSKREILRLVRRLDPLPDVPDVIEPLGPSRRELIVPANPTWQEQTAAFCAPIRELEPSERPSDWLHLNAAHVDAGALADGALGANDAALGANDAALGANDAALGAGDATNDERESSQGASTRSEESHAEASDENYTADPERALELGPQRFRIQFTANQEYVDLLEQARDLLSHTLASVRPSHSLEQVHLRALRVLVADLKRRKYALTKRAATSGPRPERHLDAGTEVASGHAVEAERVRADERLRAPAHGCTQAEPHRRGARDPKPEPRQRDRKTSEVDEVSAPQQRGDVFAGERGEPAPLQRVDDTLGETGEGGDLASCQRGTTTIAAPGTSAPRRRGRYVPAAVRRAVSDRDAGRCTHVDEQGRRCRETRYLEFHHEEPHGRGGPPIETNIRLLCRSHNALAAEEDYGRDFIARKAGRTGTAVLECVAHEP
jgi:hypothetical protein